MARQRKCAGSWSRMSVSRIFFSANNVQIVVLGVQNVVIYISIIVKYISNLYIPENKTNLTNSRAGREGSVEIFSVYSIILICSKNKDQIRSKSIKNYWK